MKNLFSIFLLLSILSLEMYGGGYQVPLQGNRQAGMGNMGTCLRPDASSLFWNPGAMGLASYNSVMLGTNPIVANVSYWASDDPYSTYTSGTDTPVSTPFHAYGHWGPKESFWKLGLGVYTPYGSRVIWEKGWRGRYIMQEISLSGLYIQPTISFKIGDKLGIGGGFVFATGNVVLKRDLPLETAGGVGSVELSGKTNGTGYNLGIYYEPIEKLSIGINYRSLVTMGTDDGEADFNIPSFADEFFPPNNSISAELPLPANLAIGVAYRPDSKTTIAFEAIQTYWSAYDTLIIDFKENTDLLTDLKSPRNYNDAWVLKIGGERYIKDSLAVRAGFSYDFKPAGEGYVTPESPNSDRLNFHIGLGYKMKNGLVFDASFIYVHGKEIFQTTNDLIEAGTLNNETGEQGALPGTYQANAFIPGLSVSYNF